MGAAKGKTGSKLDGFKPWRKRRRHRLSYEDAPRLMLVKQTPLRLSFGLVQAFNIVGASLSWMGPGPGPGPAQRLEGK